MKAMLSVLLVACLVAVATSQGLSALAGGRSAGLMGGSGGMRGMLTFAALNNERARDMLMCQMLQIPALFCLQGF